MRRPQLVALIEDAGLDHQVFRIIQLDRRSGRAHIPDIVIQWTTTVELILKGRTTDIDALPLS